ncbi:conserved Plasmodium protein, unknown function [Plasmodium vinckei lentum]|uniref:Uncharacterized protein n=1 Tax=Plasmodium vinckei lentum TaxID=138297 RepID=A0A6V7RZQ9_PLAVN|nr:conserved Plasmodium protein, unknown function [Plasmodium vinckei lentum]
MKKGKTKDEDCKENKSMNIMVSKKKNNIPSYHVEMIKDNKKNENLNVEKEKMNIDKYPEISDISTDDLLSDVVTESGEETENEYDNKLEDNEGEYKDTLYEKFQNDEINILSEEIKKKEIQLEESNTDIWKLKKRFSKIEKYIILKKKKINDLKKRIEEKRILEEEENKLCKNVEIKNMFLNKECKKIRFERDKNNEQVIKTENEYNKCIKDIEEIKSKLVYKENELNEWIDKINLIQKEEFEVEKFKLLKDKEIKKLSHNLEKLNLEKIENDKNLDKIKTEILKQSIELQCTINENKEIIKDKKNLKKKWECIVDSINSRDDTIFKLEGNFRKYLNKEKKLKEKYEHMNNNLLKEKLKIGQIENEIKSNQMSLSNIRKEENEINKRLEDLISEKDLLKKNYDHESFYFKEKSEEMKNLEILLNELEKSYKHLSLNNEKAKIEFENIEVKNLEQKDLINKIEKLLNEEENKLSLLINNIKIMDDEKFKLSQILQKSKNEYTILEAEVLGTEIKIKHMKNDIKKIEKNLERQKEIIYKFDFHTQILTKKLNSILGNNTLEKKKENQKKVLSLEKELKKYEDIFNTLNNEMKRINIELKNIKIYQNDIKIKKLNNKEMLDKLKLDIKSLETSLINENKEKENIMLIELNLKIELDKLKGTFEKYLNNLNILKDQKKIYANQEKLKDQDINANIESLKVIIKNVNEEIHKLSMLVSDKKSKCNKLELNLGDPIVGAANVECGSLGAETKESMKIGLNNENENKCIYYKIKVEEDITKLKEIIKKIDEQISKEEEEANNFEKTLNDIMQTNKVFNENIKCIDPQHKIFLKKKNKLNKKLNEINDKIAQVEQNINEYDKKGKIAENQFNNMLEDKTNIEEKLTSLKENIEKMGHKINEIFVKIERASNQLRNILSSSKPKYEKIKTTNENDKIENDQNVDNIDNISLEKKVLKKIQTESLKEKLTLLFECFKDCEDNSICKEILQVIETA